MGTTHDSKQSQRSGDSSEHAPHTPSFLWTPEQFAKYERDMKDWNEFQSGDPYFDPSLDPSVLNRHTQKKTNFLVRTSYWQARQSRMIDDCRAAITHHRTLYNADPQALSISISMYFRLCTQFPNFSGNISFFGIEQKIKQVHVFVYKDVSTDIVICYNDIHLH